jgi:hypothetical protein
MTSISIRKRCPSSAKFEYGQLRTTRTRNSRHVGGGQAIAGRLRDGRKRIRSIGVTDQRTNGKNILVERLYDG